MARGTDVLDDLTWQPVDVEVPVALGTRPPLHLIIGPPGKMLSAMTARHGPFLATLHATVLPHGEANFITYTGQSLLLPPGGCLIDR
jgi:hypothetical protein